MRTFAGPLLAAFVLICSGCAAAPAGPATATTTTATPAAAVATGPSEQAREVCEEEAQEDISAFLGVTPHQVGPPTTAGTTFTCRYVYPDGAFVLSVQDLPDDPATTAAYNDLAARLGRASDIDLGVAQAFSTSGGSVVLRKDDKVMLVDVSALPDRFGQPPITRAQAALLIMKAILGCWTG